MPVSLSRILEIRLEEFLNVDTQTPSMWTPVIMDQRGSYDTIFLLVSTFNGDDQTFSMTCLELTANSIKVSEASEFRVNFLIMSTHPGEVSIISTIFPF